MIIDTSVTNVASAITKRDTNKPLAYIITNNLLTNTKMDNKNQCFTGRIYNDVLSPI